MGTVVLSLAIFFGFAYRVFVEDKTIFIMDYNLAVLRAAKEVVQNELRTRFDYLDALVPRLVSDEASAKDVFDSLSPTFKNSVIAIRVYQKNGVGYFSVLREFIHQEFLTRRQLPNDFIDRVNLKFPLPLDEIISKDNYRLINQTMSVADSNTIIPMITYVIRTSKADSSKDLVVVANFDQDFLIDKLRQSEMAEVFLVSERGDLLSHSNRQVLKDSAETRFVHPITQHLKTEVGAEQSLELTVGDEPYLVNVGKIGFKGIFVVAEVEKKQVVQAMALMLNKTLLLAGLVISLSIVAGVVFSAHLTSNVERLNQAAMELGSGNLDVVIHVDSRDEIGMMAKTFEWMRGRVKALLIEAAQKAQLEEELRTAHLVQNTILTPPELHSDRFELASYYASAAMCGGDIWDAWVRKDELIMMVGDATGHGAPAALVTAVAKSCVATLRSEMKDNLLLPSEYLTKLNQIVFETCRGELLMTMAVVRLDLNSGKVTLSNAGHELPLCLRGESVDVEPLMVRGERLGFAKDSIFVNGDFSLGETDTLILYTDGLTEAENAKGKMWGERKLKKILKTSSNLKLAELKDSIVESVNQHVKAHPVKDDIAFVMIQRKVALRKAQAA